MSHNFSQKFLLFTTAFGIFLCTLKSKFSRLQIFVPSAEAIVLAPNIMPSFITYVGVTENARHENAGPICKGGKCGKS